MTHNPIKKQRLDLILLERYPHFTRNQIQSFIMQGKVLINDERITKPGTLVSSSTEIRMEGEELKYVSRGGFKLEAALDHFKVNVENFVAADAGISTGGFTDCLLQRGVTKVYGIDVGYGQVHEKIRTNPQVIILEKTNLRTLEQLPELVDLFTLDLSFISLLKVIPAISLLVKPTGHIIALIKPQFEAPREAISRGGVVKDPAVHQAIKDSIVAGFKEFGFTCQGIIPSPITGATSGNTEFLALFTKE